MSRLFQDEYFYGNAETEMVRCRIANESLVIETLSNKVIHVPKGKWQKKWSIIGAGKLKCSLISGGREVHWQIRIYPHNDLPVNESRWIAGRNGTFNMKLGNFSSMFPNDKDEIYDEG